MSQNIEQHELYENARYRIRQKKRLYFHFVVFLVGSVFLIILNKILNVGDTISINRLLDILFPETGSINKDEISATMNLFFMVFSKYELFILHDIHQIRIDH